jgi:hypothetical protein
MRSEPTQASFEATTRKASKRSQTRIVSGPGRSTSPVETKPTTLAL